ncbi:MAG: alpha/beta fold hydrolase [Haloarculaceae archaeon]
MKLRNVLAAAAGSVGVAAVTNRALAASADGLAVPLEGSHERYRWRGFDVAYTEAGDPTDPDLVLVHGVNAAASSHEFREVFDALAEEYHVVAPDLPGFGHSDRPALLYSAPLYVTFLRDVLDDVAEDPAVVASSLSGAYAAKAAEDASVDRLLLVCPTDESAPGRRVWLRSLLRSPVVGQALFNGLVSKRSIRHFHADHGYYDLRKLRPETVDYEWTSAHQPGARYAPASFVAGFLDPAFDLADVLGDLDAPTTLVWGREADLPPLSAGHELAERADARLVVVDESRLLPHVEHPAEFVDVVSERYGRE